MAEIISNNARKQTKRKPKSTRVDLTPMVDLGFLLITFFVFTTALQVPRAMGLIVPADTDQFNDPVPQSAVLTLIPHSGNRIYYYEGAFDKQQTMQVTTHSAEGIRRIIQNKKERVSQNPVYNKMVLILKPTVQANWKNLVDLLDEAVINMVPVYYLDDLTPEEKAVIPL